MDKTFLVELNDKTIVTNKVKIIIGDNIYRLTKSIDGKLTINKYHDDNTAICVFSRVSNEIDVL